MIRFAAEHDIGRLVEMGRNFHSSSIYADKVRFNEDALAASLRMFIASDIAVVMVTEQNENVVGVIGGIVGPHYLTGENAASELFWWVEPEHRGVGLPLLGAYEDEIAIRGARYSGMICPVGSGNVEKIYAKRGYEPMETIFYREMG